MSLGVFSDVAPAARHPKQSAAPSAKPSPASDTERLVALEVFHAFEAGFRKRFPIVWWSTLIGPFLATAAVLVLLYLNSSTEFFRSLMWAAAISFAVAGRFIILMQGLGDWAKSLSPEIMFWMVTWQDVMVALFMAFHVGFLFRLPWIGPKIEELVVDGEMILSFNPWMKHVTFAGLVAFIAFPLAATGSVGGAIFGRLLGLSRTATFAGSVIGAVLGNGAMMYLAEFVQIYLPQDSMIVQYGGLGSIVLIVVVLERRYRAMKRQFVATRNESTDSPSGTDAA